MIFIALGANLDSKYGSPEDTLLAAIKTISGVDEISVAAQSSLWITEPVPASDQPLYRNAVICVETKLDSHALLKRLHSIETEFGRTRQERNEARVIDLDLIVYNDVIVRDSEISVPHPRMHERAFVLVPMLEITSEDWMHPVLEKNLVELIDLIPDQSYKSTMQKSA